MNIRLGTKDDITQIMKIVRKTVDLMDQEGNDQWTGDYPTPDDFERDVANNTLHVAENEQGDILGMITVDQVATEEYNQVTWRQDEPYFVFHRLAVSVKARGLGLAQTLIQHAEDYAVTQGVPYMKTDTYSLNEKAQQLFEKLGYHKVGEMEWLNKDHPFYCYDKILSK